KVFRRGESEHKELVRLAATRQDFKELFDAEFAKRNQKVASVPAQSTAKQATQPVQSQATNATTGAVTAATSATAKKAAQRTAPTNACPF
ncbi:MAG: hypothetical protein HQL93_13015, partial [Magnetococcales bacterium]|nr:hypothetical protein [Magnetococcales bacterium]